MNTRNNAGDARGDMKGGEHKEDEVLRRLMEMRPALFAFFHALLPPSADVESVYQETVLAVWRAVAEGQVRSLESFTYGVARNQALMCLRKLSRDRVVLCDETVFDCLVEAWHPDRLESRARDRQDALRHCLKRLKSLDRNRLHAYYTEGRTIRSLARTERKSESALQQIFHRLRLKLRECIERTIVAGVQPA